VNSCASKCFRHEQDMFKPTLRDLRYAAKCVGDE